MNRNANLKMCFGVGAPTIIVTFVLLCLTALGALSLSTASSEYRLAQRTAEHSAAYYAAQASAHKWVAQADAELLSGRESAAATMLFPLSDRQALSVSIRIDGGHYRVVSQKLTVTESWSYDDYAPGFNDDIPQ